MGNVLETQFANGIMSVVGDPAFIGTGVMAFFMGTVFLAPAHPALKVFAFFIGVLLAMPYVGMATLLWSFGLGIIIWFAWRRIWG